MILDIILGLDITVENNRVKESTFDIKLSLFEENNHIHFKENASNSAHSIQSFTMKTNLSK